MTYEIQGSNLRQIAFGSLVKKSAATPPNSGSTASLFTVSGGSVLVTALIGRVTTALSGSTGAIALGTKPTAGTEEKSGIGTAGVVGGAEIGTKIVPIASSGLGTTLVVSGKVAGNAPFLSTPFVVDAGDIEITTSIATMTGAIDWYLAYVPLDDGASVAAD